MQLNYFTYKRDEATCPKCHWSGKGADLGIDDISEERYIMDLACPSCGEPVGFVQFPTTDQVAEWKRNHPEGSDD